MIDVVSLEARRNGRFFEDWDGFVPEEKVAASEEAMRDLIDAILKLGAGAGEPQAREAVHTCVERFNDLDDGWIATIERESIVDQIAEIVELCGFPFDDDWCEDRDW